LIIRYIFLKTKKNHCLLFFIVDFRSIGLPANAIVTKNLNDEEKYPVTQLLIDDEFGSLGPGGTRALMTAIMGSGLGMKGGPYKLLNSIRIWKSNCADDGAAAIVSFLVK
jgi:hypothetical protein